MTDHDAQATGSKELTASEWNLLLSIIDPTRPESVHFWAAAQLIHCLSEWGVSVSCWLHQCRCAHATKKDAESCHLKGRKGAALAAGHWKQFLLDLDAVKPSAECSPFIEDLGKTAALLQLRSSPGLAGQCRKARPRVSKKRF